MRSEHNPEEVVAVVRNLIDVRVRAGELNRVVGLIMREKKAGVPHRELQIVVRVGGIVDP